jgi:hypothetical protein
LSAAAIGAATARTYLARMLTPTVTEITRLSPHAAAAKRPAPALRAA